MGPTFLGAMAVHFILGNLYHVEITWIWQGSIESLSKSSGESRACALNAAVDYHSACQEVLKMTQREWWEVLYLQNTCWKQTEGFGSWFINFSTHEIQHKPNSTPKGHAFVATYPTSRSQGHRINRGSLRGSMAEAHLGEWTYIHVTGLHHAVHHVLSAWSVMKWQCLMDSVR